MAERSPTPSKPDSEPKSEAKSGIDFVVELITKALFPVGGGTTVYFLFLDKDIAKALIAFAITTGSGFLSGFFKPIKKTVDKQVEQAGESTGRTIDKNFDRARDRFTGWENAYLEALKTHCEDLEVEGFKGDLPSLPLKEIFVQLCLNVDPTRSLGGGINIPRSIWDLLPKAEQLNSEMRLAIIADPGCGKTTLTRHLAQSYANGSHRQHQAKELLPVLLRLRDIYQGVQAETLPSLVVKRIAQLPRCKDLALSSQWFEDRLQNGQCLVMLDGLDEVPESQREQVSRWVSWQMQNYPTPFVLTSRPHGYDGDLFAGVQRIGILDFTPGQKSDFIYNWYRCTTYHQDWKYRQDFSQQRALNGQLLPDQVKAESDARAKDAADDLCRQLFKSQEISALAKNPLLLTIIAATHRAFEQLPNRRVKLYQKMFNLLLEDRPNRRETHLKMVDAEKNQEVLQVLALALVKQVKTQFTPKEGSGWIADELKRQCEDTTFTPQRFLKEIQDITGLLTGEEGQLYQFSHKTFQEYLAAIALTQRNSQKLLLEKFGNSDWENVLCFCALLTSATPFVERAIANPQDQTGLELARRMLKEGSQISGEVRDRFNQTLQEHYVSEKLTTAIRLEQRLQQMVAIDSQTVIMPDPITWGEYELFLNAQTLGQFHSTAEVITIPEQLDQPATGISPNDARWFCAWLSTQTIQPGVDSSAQLELYVYRLPTEVEQQSISNATNGIYIVQERLPDRYQSLLNYLAAGQWQDADQETARVMLVVAGRQKDGYLDVESIQKFPCPDLRWIDRLWVSFSGGHFGFSIQKEIYAQTGNPLNGQYRRETFEKFADTVGWRVGNEYKSYSDFNFSFYSERGLLPWGLYDDFFRIGLQLDTIHRVVGVGVGVCGTWCFSLLSRKDL